MNRSAILFGTFGGTLIGIYPILMVSNILETILLACVGAVASFFVSLILGTLLKRKK